MKLAIELDNGCIGYGKVHNSGCRDLRDPEPIGDATTWTHAARLFNDLTGWEDPPSYAPCVKLP